jgi:hypothetical protein
LYLVTYAEESFERSSSGRNMNFCLIVGSFYEIKDEDDSVPFSAQSACRVGAVASVVRLGWGGQNRAERVDLGMSVTVWTEAGEMVFFTPSPNPRR